MFNIKTIARIAAVQILYQYGVNSYSQDINLLTQKMIKLYKQNEIYIDLENDIDNRAKIKPSINHLMDLVKYSINNLTQLDLIIEKNLDTDKKIDNISPLLLAILRIAISEITFFNATPSKVIINEFTNIASEMLNDGDTGFINFMLDKVSKETNHTK